MQTGNHLRKGYPATVKGKLVIEEWVSSEATGDAKKLTTTIKAFQIDCLAWETEEITATEQQQEDDVPF